MMRLSWRSGSSRAIGFTALLVLLLSPVVTPVALAANCFGSDPGAVSYLQDEVAGAITIDGNPAAVGTRITASYNGTPIGCATVDQAGNYAMQVNGSDTVHPSYPTASQQYSIAVNGTAAGVTPNPETFSAPQAPSPYAFVLLDLSATSSGQPATGAGTATVPTATPVAAAGGAGAPATPVPGAAPASTGASSSPEIAPDATSQPTAPAAAATGSCQFRFGFKLLHDMASITVGNCLEDEGHNPQNGDGLQHTTNGLLVWRKADNWTAFTNGYWTWINGPNGLVQRLNTQRFPWEANPDGLPLVAGSQAALS